MSKIEVLHKTTIDPLLEFAPSLILILADLNDLEYKYYSLFTAPYYIGFNLNLAQIMLVYLWSVIAQNYYNIRIVSTKKERLEVLKQQ